MTRLPSFLAAALLTTCSLSALAQNIGDTGTGAGAPPTSKSPPAPGGGAGTGVPAAPADANVTTVYRPLGLPYPGTDVNAHLPSSARGSSDTSRSSDGFDLGTADDSGGTVRGSANAPGVRSSARGRSSISMRPRNVPAVHRVQKGDTLWDVCDSYYQNPWLWPKVWSKNPQIQNPHWIYPGDELRLGAGSGAGENGGFGAFPEGGPGGDGPSSMSPGTGARSGLAPGGGGGASRGGGPLGRRPTVGKGTVFLRNVGYIDDPKKQVWGQIAGSSEEQMLLTEGNRVYVKMRPGADLKPGQALTVFHPVRTPAKVPGARRPPGEIIAFKGAVKIDSFDPKTRMAEGRLVESLDIVERGDKVGPVERAFDVIPPTPSTVNLEARILTSLYPHEVIGQNQIAFIDRGSKDGLSPGNRLLVVAQGDAWRRTLKTASPITRSRVRTDVPEHVQVEDTPLEGKDADYPREVIGELRVLRADEYSSVTIVTASRREIEPGALCVARAGY